MIRNGMEQFEYIANVVLEHYISNWLIAEFNLRYSLKSSIEMGKARSCEEVYSQFIEDLLLCISTSELNIFCHVDKRLGLGTLVDNELMVIITKALEDLLLCWPGPLGQCFQFQGIHLHFLTFDNIPSQ